MYANAANSFYICVYTFIRYETDFDIHNMRNGRFGS